MNSKYNRWIYKLRIQISNYDSEVLIDNEKMCFDET